MNTVDAFSRVIDSTERTRNAIQILRTIVFGTVLILGELCAAIGFLSQSPALSAFIGLITALPGTGIAIHSWRKRCHRHIAPRP